MRAGTVGLFVFGLTACSSLTSVFEGVLGKSTPKASLSAVQVIAEPEANQNSATALDVVFVYDTKAVEVLPKTGPEWFQGKAALLAAFPRTIDVVALQVPPAFALDVALPKRRSDAVRVMAYANYLTEAGQKAVDLTSFKRAVIRLKPDAIAFGET